MAQKQRSNSKQSVAPGLISQAAFARQHGWSPQYVSKLVQQAKLTLVDGQIDPKAANAELKANGVGMLCETRITNGNRNRRSQDATSREERLQYAIDAVLVSGATALLNLSLEDPDKAESTLKMMLADIPAMLDGTYW